MDAESLARHRWYFFKEAFSPSIVDHAIKDAALPADSIVFDPFSGSGTTVLEAGLSGMRGTGVEVNPFLRFVARTKARVTTVSKFDAALKRATAGAERGAKSPLLGFSTFSEEAPKAKARGKWLFNSSVLRAYEGARRRMSKESGREFDLVRLCLIGAAMDAANAAKDGKCLRYKNGWSDLNLDSDTFLAALETRAATVREDLESTGDKKIRADVKLGDSRSIKASEKFDLCVTSPPYLNSFDYTDVYRPELFLGGFVSDMEQLRALRLAALRSHVQAVWDNPVRDDFGTSYAEAMADLKAVQAALVAGERGLWNSRLPLMVQAYFEDMERVLKGLHQRAKPDASVWLVVSTSAYAGVEFPVDLIISDIASKSGWFLREVVVLRHLKRVSGQQWHELNEREGANGPHLRESLVILDASHRRGR